MSSRMTRPNNHSRSTKIKVTSEINGKNSIIKEKTFSYRRKRRQDDDDGDNDDYNKNQKKLKLTGDSESKITKTKFIKKNELWFDDVKKEDLDLVSAQKESAKNKKDSYCDKSNRINKIGKYIAMDCEMVGVGPDGIESALARVSIVNFHGVVILDKYVRPIERVTDFRTPISGITPKLLVNAHAFKEVQKEVAGILKDRIIIGHSINYDFQALLLDHPHRMIRDTSLYAPLRQHARGKTPSLKKLAQEELGLTIQEGEHSSVEDAQVCMLLFRKHKKEWEKKWLTKVTKSNIMK
ncbi:3461_t:CDS:2 [Ambispora gerdemannii]|uniref:RNA exonuclease 4 n=1 Tax=Ambispora gerdemannii TaxID=144530 RepID=A0A9N8V271_9GLOM|nr:3461_t:CDS:2 [Ambispora gerdemannii]